MYRPSELHGLLNTLGVRPKKGLSQNFLIDGNILDKIVQLAEVQAGDIVLEIGPGPGALTEKLLQAGCKVIAVEKDATFAQVLEEKGDPQLTVYCEDILKFSFEEKITSRAKVVANLPYHLTTPIIQKLVRMPERIERAVLMVQEEMARRCIAPCGTKEFSSFTLFLQYYTKVRYGFFVSPTCFYPVPKVGSAVIRLDLAKRYEVQDEEKFFTTTRTAFSQRRKMLTSSLKELYPLDQIRQALLRMQKPETIRPEALSIEEWVEFTNYL